MKRIHYRENADKNGFFSQTLNPFDDSFKRSVFISVFTFVNPFHSRTKHTEYKKMPQFLEAFFYVIQRSIIS
jgi:hypothetical protein